MSGAVPYGFTIISAGGTAYTARLNGFVTSIQNYSGIIPPTTTDQLIDMSFKAADVSIFEVYSDQAVNIALNAIHSGSPIATFAINAGEPYLRFPVLGDTNPVPSDCTKMYVNNAGGTLANLIIKVYLASSSS